MFLKTRESFTWLCDSSSDLASYGFDADKPIKINPKLFTATHRGIHMPEISNIYSNTINSAKIEVKDAAGNIVKDASNNDKLNKESNNLCVLFYNSQAQESCKQLEKFMGTSKPLSKKRGFGRNYDDTPTIKTFNFPDNDFSEKHDNDKMFNPSDEGSIIIDFKFKYLKEDKKLVVPLKEERNLFTIDTLKIFFRNTKDKGLRLGVYCSKFKSDKFSKEIYGNSIDPDDEYKQTLYGTKEFNNSDDNKEFRLAVTFKNKVTYVIKNGNITNTVKKKNVTIDMILETKVNPDNSKPTYDYIGKGLFNYFIKDDDNNFNQFISSEKEIEMKINDNTKNNNNPYELNKNNNKVILNNKYIGISDFKESYLTNEGRNLIDGVIHTFDIYKRHLNGTFYTPLGKFENVSMVFRAYDCNEYKKLCDCENINYYPTIRFYQKDNFDKIKKIDDYPLGKPIHWQWVSSWIMGWNRYNLDRTLTTDNTKQSGYDEGSKDGDTSTTSIFPYIDSDTTKVEFSKITPITDKTLEKRDLYDGSHRWALWPKDNEGLESIDKLMSCISE